MGLVVSTTMPISIFDGNIGVGTVVVMFGHLSWGAQNLSTQILPHIEDGRRIFLTHHDNAKVGHRINNVLSMVVVNHRIVWRQPNATNA